VAVGLLAWAVITCYSRPYLGKHYPGDVVCGALLGILMGYLVHLIASWIEKKLQQRETKK
jgi:undecaprenyl-diphosphatase